MTLTNENLGQNITNAVEVLLATYQSINKLLAELDRIGEEEGFITITPKFMRRKSDVNIEGWLTKNFIKLYQLDSDSSLTNLPDMREGELFGIEIDLESDDYPVISLTRYSYDYRIWTKMPTTSDHWIFYDPFRFENNFTITEENGKWESKPYEKAKKKYWGLQYATSESIPLIRVTSPEAIRTEIFQRFLRGGAKVDV